jgi:hypothetical protein
LELVFRALVEVVQGFELVDDLGIQGVDGVRLTRKAIGMIETNELTGPALPHG